MLCHMEFRFLFLTLFISSVMSHFVKNQKHDSSQVLDDNGSLNMLKQGAQKNEDRITAEESVTLFSSGAKREIPILQQYTNQLEENIVSTTTDVQIMKEMIENYARMEMEMLIMKQNIVKLQQNSVMAAKEIGMLKQKVNQLEHQNKDLQNDIFSLRQENKEMKNISSSIDSLKTDMQKLLIFKEGASYITSAENTRKRVGFTAGMVTFSTWLTESILVFPKVIYNAGNGYNATTGIFTAPVGGDYVFYVSAQSSSHTNLYLDITVNGDSKVRTMSWSPGSPVNIYQTGTNLVVYPLRAGDKVWVSQSDGHGYFSVIVPITTFSGFRL